MLARATFVPNDYSSTSAKETIGRVRNLEIVKKGKNRAVKFDRNEIDSILSNMKKHSSYRIQDLKGELKKEYDLVIRLVDLLYDTDGYQNLHDLVKKHFGDVDNAKPGTLCAYFAGCLMGDNQGNKCGVLCSGSMQLPKSLSKGKCGETVILCTYDDHSHRYHFRVLSASDNKSEAIVYMESGTSETFRGFSEHEKSKLKGMGIKKVSINWSRDHGKKDCNPKIDIDRILVFKGDFTVNNDNNNDDDGNSGSDFTFLWIILIVIIIIAIILFLANS